MKRVSVKALLVTRGPEGMNLYEKRKSVIRKTHIPVTQTHEVYDVTGAGDTVTGVMGLAAFGGVPLVQAAKLSNVAAGIVVGMVGTAVVEPEALDRAMDGGLFLSGLKVLSRSALKIRMEEARERREKVVFTNGCFDLLHVGHLHLLQRARAFGDLLVVGINDDESIRKLKGPGRPLITQEQRAEILASLRFVDHVTIFSEPTPLRVLRAVRPDVLVKGGDYSLKQVIGKKWVENNGGRVELVPLLPGFSTSSLISAILNSER
jgi:D-beta-D-heptose 7-phosphate kinase/D-beta-D-heptose 1-phosphate adenosyltransferase